MGCAHSKTVPNTPQAINLNRRRRSSLARQKIPAELQLGAEADAARPPARRMHVVGPKRAGKTALIRHIRALYDGDAPEDELRRYTAPVRKTALASLHCVLRAALPSLNGDLAVEAKRVLEMSRREALSDEGMASLARVSSDAKVRTALDALRCAEERSNAAHSLSLLDTMMEPDFTPSSSDLLRMYTPTVGEQETRVRNLQSGSLSLVESSLDKWLQRADAAPDAGKRLDASVVVFVASALSVPAPTEGMDVESDPAVDWRRVRDASERAGVPCFLLLSKLDLLPPGGGALRRGQLLAHFGVVPEEVVAAQPGHGVLNFLDRRCTKEAFENLLAAAFGGAETVTNELDPGVYLGLALFAESDRGGEPTVLTERGGLPCVHLQAEPLTLMEQEWLHQLPQPLVLPQRMSPEQAAQCGAAHAAGTLQASMWSALSALATKAGNVGDGGFGTLHSTPLLMPPATAMIVLRRNLGASPAAVARGLAWMPLSAAARSMAPLLAGELRSYARSRRRSYLPEMEVQRKRSVEDLSPSVWLSRLCDLTSRGAPLLTPGTHVCAFYLSSSLQGLQVLVPEDEPSMIPAVKISNAVVSPAEWSDLRTTLKSIFAAGVESDDDHTWLSAAATWLGPSVSPEANLTLMQKFFFGVQALRQRLGCNCTATKDDYGLGSIADARGSLESLGSLLQLEHLPAVDDRCQTRVIIAIKYFSMDRIDSFPANLLWLPLELFEARHYSRYLPATYPLYLATRQALDNAGRRRSTIAQRCDVEGSSSSGDSSGSDSASDEEQDATARAVGELAARKEHLQRVWGGCRWSRTAALSATGGGSGGAPHPNGVSVERRRSIVSVRRSSNSSARAAECAPPEAVPDIETSESLSQLHKLIDKLRVDLQVDAAAQSLGG